MTIKKQLLDEFEKYLFENGFGESVGDSKITFLAGAKCAFEMAAKEAEKNTSGACQRCLTNHEIRQLAKEIGVET